ncbi:hypothetical protein OC842_004728, partial [Tilletia horrida]
PYRLAAQPGDTERQHWSRADGTYMRSRRMGALTGSGMIHFVDHSSARLAVQQPQAIGQTTLQLSFARRQAITRAIPDPDRTADIFAANIRHSTSVRVLGVEHNAKVIAFAHKCQKHFGEMTGAMEERTRGGRRDFILHFCIISAAADCIAGLEGPDRSDARWAFEESDRDTSSFDSDVPLAQIVQPALEKRVSDTSSFDSDRPLAQLSSGQH